MDQQIVVVARRTERRAQQSTAAEAGREELAPKLNGKGRFHGSDSRDIFRNVVREPFSGSYKGSGTIIGCAGEAA